MRAGQLRHRVTIKSNTANANDPDPDYTNLHVGIPAGITETSGGETYRGRQLEAHVKAVIETRYLDDVDEDCQVVGTSYPYVGKTWGVTAAKIVRRSSNPVALELECTT